jgi:hypothetical protein
LTLTGSLEFTPRLENFFDELKRHRFPVSMFRQSQHAIEGGKDGSHEYKKYRQLVTQTIRRISSRRSSDSSECAHGAD